MTKKQTPYSRLLDEFREYYNSIRYARMKTMGQYPKDKLSDTWTLSDLYERTAAAEQMLSNQQFAEDLVIMGLAIIGGDGAVIPVESVFADQIPTATAPGSSKQPDDHT